MKGWRQWGVAAMILLATLAWMLPAHASDHRPFRVVRAGSVLYHGVYYMDATFALSLKPAAVEALKNGVPLVFKIHIKLSRRRAFLWDPTVAELIQSHRITYHVLSRRYVVQNINSGEQASYRHWQTALKSLDHVRDLPIIDASLLDAGEHYDLHVRAEVDVKIIPTGFGLLTQVFYGADQSSDWYEWTMR